MQPEGKSERSYPISQSELRGYRNLGEQLKRDAEILAGWRYSLIDRMGGPDVVEPGPLKPQLVYHDTGQTTQTEEGRVPIVKRHLVITG